MSTNITRLSDKWYHTVSVLCTRILVKLTRLLVKFVRIIREPTQNNLLNSLVISAVLSVYFVQFAHFVHLLLVFVQVICTRLFSPCGRYGFWLLVTAPSVHSGRYRRFYFQVTSNARVRWASDTLAAPGMSSYITWETLLYVSATARLKPIKLATHFSYFAAILRLFSQNTPRNTKHSGWLYTFHILRAFSQNTTRNTKHSLYTFRISYEFRVLLMLRKNKPLNPLTFCANADPGAKCKKQK